MYQAGITEAETIFCTVSLELSKNVSFGFNIHKLGKDQKDKAVLCRRFQVLEKSCSSQSWLGFFLTHLFISSNCFFRSSSASQVY